MQRLDRGGRVVDEVSLCQDDNRPGAAVPRQHELAFETALVGWRRERVHQHHDVDVGGDGLSLGAIALERCAANEGTATRQHDLDPVELCGWNDPVADRDIGADVADAQRVVIEVAQHRAPSSIEPSDTTGKLGEPGLPPRRVQLLIPAETNVTPLIDIAESSVAQRGNQSTAEAIDRFLEGSTVLARLARFSFRRRRFMVFAIWLPFLIGLSAISAGVGTDYHTDFALPDSDSKVVQDALLAGADPEDGGWTAQIVFTSPNGTDDPAVKAAMEPFFAEVDKLEGVKVDSPYSPEGALVQQHDQADLFRTARA